MKANWLWIVLLMVTSACAHQKIVASATKAGKDGVVSVWADWVKPKGNKYDLHFHIKNVGENAIIIKLGDMSCLRGDVTGTMKYTFFNTGERTIDLMPSQDKHANMVCSFAAPLKGDFKIVIRRVFANPKNDGETLGDVVAKDLVWEFPEGSKAPAKAE